MDKRSWNTLINGHELRRNKIALCSTPPWIFLETNWRCNARCVFCEGVDYPPFSLRRYRDFFEPRLRPALENCQYLRLCGAGETLLMPDILPFIDHLSATLPAPLKMFNTNGMALTATVLKRLTAGNYSISVSLHASYAALHEQMTGGTKAFDTILSHIRNSIALRRAASSALRVQLMFVATQLNIDDLASFITLAGRLGVDSVVCSHMTVFTPEQLNLSCFFDQRRFNDAVVAATERARELGVAFSAPLQFGRYPPPPNGVPRCREPWNYMYVKAPGVVNPCCFGGRPMGSLIQHNVARIWNGPSYRHLRTGQAAAAGPAWCQRCSIFDKNNINDIRSHLSLRPDIRKKLLHHLTKHAAAYGLSPKTLSK